MIDIMFFPQKKRPRKCSNSNKCLLLLFVLYSVVPLSLDFSTSTLTDSGKREKTLENVNANALSNITIYILGGGGRGENKSIFTTDFLIKYGSGVAKFIVKRIQYHKRLDNDYCPEDIVNAPCLVVGKSNLAVDIVKTSCRCFAQCDHDNW